MRFLLLSLLLVPVSAFAHGEAPSLEAEVGEYLIDIGYTDLAAKTDVEFDIDLFLAGPPIAYAEFASVEVRFSSNGAELATATVPNDGVHVPVVTVNFPAPGGYDMDVRYLDAAGSLIVARTFYVEIPGTAGVLTREGLQGLSYVIAGVLLAASLGVGGYSLLKRYKYLK